jgi:hypothetical protein
MAAQPIAAFIAEINFTPAPNRQGRKPLFSIEVEDFRKLNGGQFKQTAAKKSRKSWLGSKQEPVFRHA